MTSAGLSRTAWRRSGRCTARGACAWSRVAAAVFQSRSNVFFARSLALFGALHRAGRLRVDQATEIAGIDNIDHRGPAYPDFVIASHD